MGLEDQLERAIGHAGPGVNAIMSATMLRLLGGKTPQLIVVWLPTID